MKKAVLIAITLFFANDLSSQHLEAYLSVDSRGGYSTNTFLRPFIGEWDQSDSGSYTHLSPSAEIYLDSGRFSGGLSGGYFFEPTFDSRKNWSGIFGSGYLNYRISNEFTFEVRSSANRISSLYNRATLSVLPAISWSPSLFTRIRVRAGSSYREHSSFETAEQEGTSGRIDRFDVYGLEAERWMSLKWQIKGSVYSLVDENILENHSFSMAVSRVIRQSGGVTFDLSVNRYQNSFAIDGQGGITPVNEAVTEGTQLIENTDRLLRSRLSYSFPIIDGLSVYGSFSHLLFMPDASDNRTDAEVSFGFRYRMSTSGLFRNNKNTLTPEWESRSDHAVILKVRYRGEGDLHIVGEFNDWQRPGVQLSRQGEGTNRYAAQMDLEPGIYEYKVLLIKDGDNRWVELSDETMTISDGFGGTNGLIYID